MILLNGNLARPATCRILLMLVVAVAVVTRGGLPVTVCRKYFTVIVYDQYFDIFYNYCDFYVVGGHKLAILDFLFRFSGSVNFSPTKEGFNGGFTRTYITSPGWNIKLWRTDSTISNLIEVIGKWLLYIRSESHDLNSNSSDHQISGSKILKISQRQDNPS